MEHQSSIRGAAQQLALTSKSGNNSNNNSNISTLDAHRAASAAKRPVGRPPGSSNVVARAVVLTNAAPVTNAPTGVTAASQLAGGTTSAAGGTAGQPGQGPQYRFHVKKAEESAPPRFFKRKFSGITATSTMINTPAWENDDDM